MTDATAIWLENVMGLLLLVAAVVLPWVGLLAVLRRLRGKGTFTRWAEGSAASLMAFLASALGLVFTVCSYPGPPGTGAVARAAERRADHVAELLTASKAATGRFPATLRDIAPSGLPDSVLPRFEAVVGESLAYHPTADGSGYVLSFGYTGPGRNHCERIDTAPSWKCGGYF